MVVVGHESTAHKRTRSKDEMVGLECSALELGGRDVHQSVALEMSADDLVAHDERAAQLLEALAQQLLHTGTGHRRRQGGHKGGG